MPSGDSASTPATFRRSSMTSFGHLTCDEEVGGDFDRVRGGNPADQPELRGSGSAAGGWRNRPCENRGSRRRLPAATKPAPPRRLVVGDCDRALGQPGPEQERLRGLALRLDTVGLAEAAAEIRIDRAESQRARRDAQLEPLPAAAASGSMRTADTLYSGVPIRESPTSCVSQFTFAWAKWRAIHTSPG